MRDPETGNSKGFAFVNFASFEASDAAIDAMNGQYLCNRAISISYAFKKDSKGERHGSAAERLLAAQNPLSIGDRPHQLFADAPPVGKHCSGSHIFFTLELYEESSQVLEITFGIIYESDNHHSLPAPISFPWFP